MPEDDIKESWTMSRNGTRGHVKTRPTRKDVNKAGTTRASQISPNHEQWCREVVTVASSLPSTTRRSKSLLREDCLSSAPFLPTRPVYHAERPVDCPVD